MLSENPVQVKGRALVNRCIAPEHHLLTIAMPDSFPTPAPGQFVMLREARRLEPILSRPLSVFGFRRSRKGTSLDLLFRIAGRGTAILAALQEGSYLDVMGPLGRGFNCPDDLERVLFVAGGIGVAPLAYLFHSLKNTTRRLEMHFYLGAKTVDLLMAFEQFEGHCSLGLCTDDGSRGFHGTVTERLRQDLNSMPRSSTVIYACGPTPMIRSLGHLLEDRSIPCQVSLEERMACGLGACLGCVVAARDTDGQLHYRRVCQEGPVFDIRELCIS